MKNLWEKKANQTKRSLINAKGKHTNLGNELFDARICREGTSYKLGIQHELHHVHIFYEDKRGRRLRRGGTRIQEGGLPLARQGEKTRATVRRSNNRLWTIGRRSIRGGNWWRHLGSDRWTVEKKWVAQKGALNHSKWQLGKRAWVAVFFALPFSLCALGGGGEF